MSPDRNRSPINRRRFAIALGTVGVGGSALLGSGALSRTEPQRSVKIESVDDEDAYLRLLYSDIKLEACKETEVTLLSLTNQFKTPLDSIEVDVTTTGDIELSVLSVPESLEIGERGVVTATIECPEGGQSGTVEFVIEVDGENTSMESHRPKRHEDEIEIGCPADCPDVSFVAFTKGDSNIDDDFEVTDGPNLNQLVDKGGTDGPDGCNKEFDAVELEWETNQPVFEFIVHKGTCWYLYDYEDGTTGETVVFPDDADDAAQSEPGSGNTVTFDGEDSDEAVRCPASPGFGVTAKKFEYDGEFQGPEETKDSC